MSISVECLITNKIQIKTLPTIQIKAPSFSALQQFSGGCLIARNQTMKSKILFFGALFLFFANVIQAQITNEYETISVTNWVKPGAFLRVVDGVTYNVAFSQKWNTFAKYEALMTPLPDMDNIIGGYPGTLYRVPTAIKTNSNAIVYEIDSVRSSIDAPTQQISEDKTVLKYVVVLNYSDATGKSVNFYCMRTTNYLDRQGKVFVCYNCGFQATNLVEVVKKVNVSNGSKPAQ
jgi:hypothetical protein